MSAARVAGGYLSLLMCNHSRDSCCANGGRVTRNYVTSINQLQIFVNSRVLCWYD